MHASEVCSSSSSSTEKSPCTIARACACVRFRSQPRAHKERKKTGFATQSRSCFRRWMPLCRLTLRRSWGERRYAFCVLPANRQSHLRGVPEIKKELSSPPIDTSNSGSTTLRAKFCRLPRVMRALGVQNVPVSGIPARTISLINPYNYECVWKNQPT